MRLLISLYLTLQVSLLAQTAVLQGVVTDGTGASVRSAKITLTGQNGRARTENSDGRGEYSFAALTPGAFTLEVAASQLILVPTSITITAGTNIRDLQLSILAVKETINVGEDEPPSVNVDASSNAAAIVLKGEDLAALSDSPEDLVADLQALAGPSAGPRGGTIYVDGLSGGEIPPKESIREIRINANPFSPEFDTLGLGRIEILTKPGADKWRGTLNYNYATSAWNTRNPYSAVKAPLLLNEWENVISGPLSKRMSLAVDAYQNNVDNGSIVNAVTLNPQDLTRSPFFDAFKTIQRRSRLYPRIDYQLNDKHVLSMRYSYTKGDILGAGIGGFDLVSRGYHTKYSIHTVQAIETAVLSATAINETRFQYYRNDFGTTPNSLDPAVQALGAFTSGGSTAGHARDLQQDLEFHNITTMNKGAHTWRFGLRARVLNNQNVSPRNFNGTFTFSGGLAPVLDANNRPVPNVTSVQIDSLERYRRTILFQGQGNSLAQIRALGGGPSQFSIAAGTPQISARQVDVGLFFAEDWRVRQSLTLNLGLRYETQTNIHDLRDWAPRIGVAWAPGGGGKKAPAMVFRAGVGFFYDRFALSGTQAAMRFNGVLQQQFVVSDPDFFGTIPSIASLGSKQTAQVTQKVDSNLRAPYIVQSSASVERQLKGATVALSYTNSHGVHSLRSLDINAPRNGVYPLGQSNPLFLMTSSGIYNQNQVSVNVNAKVNKSLSLTGSYTWNRARSNTDGLGTFPANPYNYAGEYGAASTDIRHRVSLGGTINAKWAISLAPLMTLQSGAPFDITTGSDLYGTTLFNARPGMANDPGKAGVIQTVYGLLDPKPVPGQTLLPRNFGRGPGQMLVNLKIGKTMGLGPAGKDGHRFNATLSMSIRNLLNHTNPGPIIGNVTSPLFGRANQIAGTVNGEGFSENASNRRLELQLRVAF